jgi:hypothetical protein
MLDSRRIEHRLWTNLAGEYSRTHRVIWYKMLERYDLFGEKREQRKEYWNSLSEDIMVLASKVLRK